MTETQDDVTSVSWIGSGVPEVNPIISHIRKGVADAIERPDFSVDGHTALSKARTATLTDASSRGIISDRQLN